MSEMPEFSRHFWNFYQKTGDISHCVATMAVSDDGKRMAIAQSTGYQAWHEVHLYLWDLERIALQCPPRFIPKFRFFQFRAGTYELLMYFNSEYHLLNPQLESVSVWRQTPGKPFYFNGRFEVLINEPRHHPSIKHIDLEGQESAHVVNRSQVLACGIGYPTWYKRYYTAKGKEYPPWIKRDHPDKDREMIPLIATGMAGETSKWHYAKPFNLAYFHAPSRQLLVRDDYYLYAVPYDGRGLPPFRPGSPRIVLTAEQLRVVSPQSVVTLKELVQTWRCAFWAYPDFLSFAAIGAWSREQRLEVPDSLQQQYACCLALSPDQRWLLAGGRVIALWDLATGALSKVLEAAELGAGELPICYKLVFLDTEHFLAIQADDRAMGSPHTAFAALQQPDNTFRLSLWHLGSLTCLKSFPLTGSSTAAQLPPVLLEALGKVKLLFEVARILALSEDERWLAIATPRQIRLWDLRSGTLARTFDWAGAQAPLDCSGLYFLDNQRLLSRHDAYFLLWSCESGEVLADPEKWLARPPDIVPGAEESELPKELAQAREIQLSPDGRHLFALASSLSVWDMASGRQIDAFSEVATPIQCLAQADGAPLLLTGGNFITLWNSEDFSPIRTYRAESPCIRLQFLSDSRFLSLHVNGTFKLWQIDSPGWKLAGWSEYKGRCLILTPEGYFKASDRECLDRYFPRIWKQLEPHVAGLTPANFLAQYHQPDRVDAALAAFYAVPD
ncbi:MAG: WD40 repeat domain-containing protein [Candidatus Sericytochromatia bacterium]